MYQIKRITVLFLVAVILCAFCQNTVYASAESPLSSDNESQITEAMQHLEEVTIPEESILSEESSILEETEEFNINDSECISITQINPLYQDIIQDSDLVQPDETQIATYSAAEYAATQQAAGAQLRDFMKNRQETFTVYYQSSEAYYDGLSTDIVEHALEHTGNPTEGDYLRWLYAGFKARITIKSENNIYYFTLEYTFTYYTSLTQESEVTQSTQQILFQLNLTDKSDYEKIYEIYKYICQHVTYDNIHLNDETYKLKFTAYAALKHGTAVCQGYALLFYRLALEVGLDARIISGKGNSIAHGWNIVRLNGVYYNLDTTWDASPINTNYAWFLKCDENFSNHTRDPRFADKDFYNTYPMASNDHSRTMIDISGSSIILASDSYTYTGAAIIPNVSVICADRTLLERSDYIVSGANNMNAGTAILTITGIGNYTGSLTRTFMISPRSIRMASAATIPNQTYTGRAITPIPIVLDGTIQLAAQRDYILSYTGNIQEGTATILITGIGNYTDTLKVSFQIVAPPANGWQQTDGKWYYYVNHTRQTGWIRPGNTWYYLNSTGVMLTGWQKVSNKWYYMNGSGAMLTGWQKVSGKWYYLSSSGAMLTGWQKVSGKWYYLSSSGAMLTGWQKISGKWYYLNSSGVMLTGWQKVSGKWYYLNSSGAMLTGWQKISGKWYYLNSSGAMLTGWQKISGKWYYMKNDGAMVNSDIRINGKMHQFDSNGVWLGES